MESNSIWGMLFSKLYKNLRSFGLRFIAPMTQLVHKRFVMVFQEFIIDHGRQ